jgi:hypothetical protein
LAGGGREGTTRVGGRGMCVWYGLPRPYPCTTGIEQNGRKRVGVKEED